MIALIATAACSGKVGVHAVITLPSGWDAARPFDHIRVEARAGDRASVACLFPLDNVGANGIVAALDPQAQGRYACADRGPQLLDEQLDGAAWGFEARGTRTVNFVWGDRDSLTLSASAGFGGKLDVYTATATATADGDFPDVALALGSPGPPILGIPVCPIELWKVAHTFACPAGQEVACLFPADGTRHHTSGMFGVKGLDPDDPKRPACRTYNTNTKCNAMINSLVTFTGLVDVPKTKPGVVQVPISATVRGRYARCSNGAMTDNCPVTTDCTPPFTALVTTTRATMIEPPKLSLQPISCLPPTAGFVEMRIRLVAAADPNSATVNVGVLAQDTKLPPSDKHCFFDLLGIDYDFDIK